MAIIIILELNTQNVFGVNAEDCNVFADYDVSPANYLTLNAHCDESTPPLEVQVEKIVITLNKSCVGSLQVKILISNATSLTYVYIWDSFNTIEYLNGSSFEDFINVREMNLVGFEKLRYLSGDVFQPLKAIERLFLKGFGFTFLQHKDIGLALAGLSGTPLTVIVMDSIHGVLSQGEVLDLSDLFQIRNVSIQTWVYSNNFVSAYTGMASEVLPDLRYFCIGISGPVNYLSYAEFVLDLLIRSKNLTDFVMYSLTAFLNPNHDDWAMKGLKLLSTNLYSNLTQYANPDCNLGIEFPLTPTLQRLELRGNLVYYPQGGTACIYQRNALLSASLSNDDLNGVMPIVKGMQWLKDVTIRNMNVAIIPMDFFKPLLSVETFRVSQLSLGSFVATLNNSFFGYRPTLRIVEMSNCDLIKLPKQTFELLSNMYWLDLSFNKLSEFDVSLDCRGSLSVLDLSHNALRTLPAAVIQCLSAVAETTRMKNDKLTVNLTGNTMSCLCDNIYFVRWITTSAGGNTIYFPNIDSYECILPNNSRTSIHRVNVVELENDCEVLQRMRNESDCPCDDITRDQLKRIPLSLEGYYCRTVHGEQVPMSGSLTACINFYLRAQFLAPVIIGCCLAISLVILIILLYRYRHNRHLQPIVECLSIERIVGLARRLLMLRSQAEEPASFTDDIFLYVHIDDYEIERTIAERLSTVRRVFTQTDIVCGGFILEALINSAKQSRWIVPVLTPTSIADPLFILFISDVLVQRPLAIVPIMWTPETVRDTNETIVKMFRLAEPLHWPGDGDEESVNERRDTFWNELLIRTNETDEPV